MSEGQLITVEMLPSEILSEMLINASTMDIGWVFKMIDKYQLGNERFYLVYDELSKSIVSKTESEEVR